MQNDGENGAAERMCRRKLAGLKSESQSGDSLRPCGGGAHLVAPPKAHALPPTPPRAVSCVKKRETAKIVLIYAELER